MTDKMREAFERHVRTKTLMSLEKFNGGAYRYNSTELAWETWQAAQAEQATELESQRVPEGWRLVPTRCPLCEYQHGHKIGCENNPVDIAMLAAALEDTTGRDMNAPANIEIPTLPGTPVAGGFFAGLIRIGDDTFALVVAPKAAGHTRKAWGEYGKTVEGARSYNDGMANTLAMAEAGYALAQWARELNIDGFDDWYIPSRDELEVCYRHLKPTAEENYCYFRSGDNPSSVPVGYPYMEESPAQTASSAFQEGGEEAFDDSWHWASTQYSANRAWMQDFAVGDQHYNCKSYEYRARAVRRFKIQQPTHWMPLPAAPKKEGE